MAKVILKSYIKSLHGRIGNVIHYNMYGCQYARSYTVPRNPRTAEQQRNRLSFSCAVKLWQQLSPAEKNRYNRIAEGRPLSGYNIFISLHMRGLTLKIMERLQRGEVNGRYISGYTLIQDTSVYHTPCFVTASVYPVWKRSSQYKPPGLSASAA